MPTPNYIRLALALETRTPLACHYGGPARTICPILLGYRGGEAMTLAVQVAGWTRQGPLIKPQWKCLRVAAMSDLALADAAWNGGEARGHAQHCVEQVDYGIDPAGGPPPRRSLGDLNAAARSLL